jgi:hypothetical protein
MTQHDAKPQTARQDQQSTSSTPRQASSGAPRRPRNVDCSEAPVRSSDSRIAPSRLPGRPGRD